MKGETYCKRWEEPATSWPAPPTVKARPMVAARPAPALLRRHLRDRPCFLRRDRAPLGGVHGRDGGGDEVKGRRNTINDILLRLVIREPERLEDRHPSCPPTGCWEWPGAINKGYGRVSLNGRVQYAHRLVFEHFVGPIPEGLEPDHLCRNRRCANFEHLQPVTRKENNNRGAGPWATRARKTHCKHGHLIDRVRLSGIHKGVRYCGTCHRDQVRRARNGKQ